MSAPGDHRAAAGARPDGDLSPPSIPAAALSPAERIAATVRRDWWATRRYAAGRCSRAEREARRRAERAAARERAAAEALHREETAHARATLDLLERLRGAKA